MASQASKHKQHLHTLLHRTLWAVMVLATVLWSSASHAQRTFAQRYTTNAPGDIVLVGNTLTTCNSTSGNNFGQCANAQSGSATTVSPLNNSFTIVNIDIDGDGTTFNSSSANLNLPGGSTVLFAGLYWGGNSNNAARNQIRFRTPAGAYTTITASQLDNVGNQYQGFANVTSQVATGGNGTYFGANVQTAVNTTGSYAGWSLVVVYQNSALPTRNLVVYDGYQRVQSSAPTVDINLSGFVTPATGTVASRIGTVAYEGDRSSTEGTAGLSFGPSTASLSPVSNAVNPQNDYYNSTISQDGVSITSRSPSYNNTLGFDIDRSIPNTPLPNGATTATVRISATTETVDLGVVTLATDIFIPDIKSSLLKSGADVNGGALLPGDEIEYTINFTNSGQDGATQMVVTDNIPANTTYVPNSLNIVSSPGGIAGPKSDTGGNDQAEYIAAAPARVVFRVGSGANATAGGLVSPTQSVSVRFRVRVNAATPGDTQISNQAQVDFRAQTLNTAITDLSDSDTSAGGDQPFLNTVASPDVVVTKTHTGDFPRGSTGTYTLTVTNNGTAPTFGTVSVADTLPAGLTATAISGTGWTCTLATLTCTRTDILAAGASHPPITLTVSVAANAANSVTNTAAVTNAAEGSTRTSNNTATDPTNISAVADVRITKTNNTNSLVTGTTTSYTITVQNLGPSAADGTVLRDPAVTGLNATAVSCGGAAGGAACPAAAAVTVANLQGTGVTVPTLPAGGSLSFTVTGTINATGQP
jgi:uncharacterized repeat protein (TIGR01451 family)